ncbi:MAG TPA: phosphoribosylanthranilate isomerase [Acidimicrobiales bacterium]|nr:phosphoribosylanthranilate isomerase [Acidimicrobiales bacterium]
MFVKICGTTSEEDALLAVAMGADAVGFIFAPSPRQIAPVLAGDIAKRLPPEVLTVGVFRDQSPQRVVEIMEQSGLRAAQLHGRETPEDTTWVRRRVRTVIKCFAAGEAAVTDAARYGADVILLDAATPGSGQVFDWRLAEGVPAGQRLLLAGGLDAGNVAEAIAKVHPWGVDAITGTESALGKKDPRKLRAFISAAKAAAHVEYQGEGAGPYDWQEDL